MSRRAWLIVGGTASAVVLLYALAGFLWLPRYVQSAVVETFERDYGRHAEIARPRFNPFTFEFEATAFSVPDADGARLLGFDRLYVDFNLSSLWRRAWTFGAITIERPYLRLVQRADGSLNLAELTSARPEEPDAESAMPALIIGELSVAAGAVDIEDRMRAEAFKTSLRPVNFALTDFRSMGVGNAFSFSAGSDRAGRLWMEGTLGFAPLQSKGTVSLTGLPATTVSEYLADLLPVTLLAGRIDLLNLGYDFRLAGAPYTLVLALPAATARDLATVAHGYEAGWQIPQINLGEARVDVAARKVRIGALEVRDAVLTAWLDRDGFHAPGAMPRPEPAPAAAAPAEGATWQLELPLIRIVDASVALEDRRIQPAAAFGIVVKDLRIDDLAMPQRAPVSLSATLADSSGGELGLQGTLENDPLRFLADVSTTDLDLRAVQPYLDAGTDLKLQSGTLTSRGRIEYADAAEPRLRYAGDLSVSGLHTRDGTLGEDFINWSRLEVRKLEYRLQPARLGIGEIVAKDPYLRLILAESGVTNVQSVLDPEGAARLAAEIAAERAGRESKKPRRGRRADKNQAPAPPVQQPSATPRMPARIGAVRIANGNVNFSDFTLRPSFQIAIERLGGTITGLTSVPADRARIELAGEVDRYAPAHIGGELNLLAAQSYMDIAADFRNVELTSFNPYSGKFAGYRIDKGKLSIETRYRVESRRLNASHRFTLDQLQLGERVESPDAVSLPLKLAIALLKDRNGVIDIDLPVTGSLDDPKFRLGPIIWKALLNLLGKIVTAPFALLGSLFGGGADLSDVGFAPGSAELDAASSEKLAALKKALIERPGLNIDVPATVDPQGDREAVEAGRWAALIGSTPISDRAAYRDRLIALHREKLGRRPELPKPPKPTGNESPVDPVEHAIDLLERALRATVAVTDADLSALGQVRAEAVRDALLGDGVVDPARVFLIRGEPVAMADGSVRMQLTLK